jgi:hypothetical protein
VERVLQGHKKLQVSRRGALWQGSFFLGWALVWAGRAGHACGFANEASFRRAMQRRGEKLNAGAGMGGYGSPPQEPAATWGVKSGAFFMGLLATSGSTAPLTGTPQTPGNSLAR